MSAGEPHPIHRMRERYDVGRLLEGSVHADPLVQVRSWLEDAMAYGLPEPNAMALATSTPDGRPSVRHVLLKELDGRGLVFYTHRDSRKGRELAANPWAAAVFPWFPMARQVVVEGPVEPLPRAAAEAYWTTRPYESQVGSAVSPQSTVIESREWLEQRAAALAAEHPVGVPLPADWGGYRLVVERLELWQGGPGRLHDRLRYRRGRADDWVVERLSP